jgi:phosphatidylserine/phosphatidylglycerophosphate/cardiolipin synthase-like enzyme
VRTVPAGFYPFAPDGEYGIYHAVINGIRRAQRFVYLENQYLWSPLVVGALSDLIEHPPSDSFRVVILLPARAMYGRYDNDAHVRDLASVDQGQGIFHAYTLYTGGPSAGKTGYVYAPTYIHAKVNIVDDEWLCVGSANLNGRGLATDTEMDVQAIDADAARRLRVQLWAEHLDMPEETVAAADPITLIDGAWRERATALQRSIIAEAPRPPGQVVFYHPDQSMTSRVLDFVQDVTLEH